MSFDLSQVVNSGDQYTPLKMVVYGVQGIGKTSFASTFESPILIRTEDGAEALNIPTFPKVATHMNEIYEAFNSLYSSEHNFKTLIIDSLDWLEPLVLNSVCESYNNSKNTNISNIEDIGYGKGYIYADDIWRNVLAWLDSLRRDKGLQIVIIAHSDIKSFNDPSGEPFDRYQIKMQKRAFALWQEWADTVVFCNYMKTLVHENDKTKKTRATGQGERALYTEERPSYLAKNRRGLPQEVIIGKDKTWFNFHAALETATNGKYKNPQNKG